MTDKPALTRHEHGFQFGTARVSALASDDKRGWTVVGIDTPKHKLQVVVTKTGRVRLYMNGMEVCCGK